MSPCWVPQCRGTGKLAMSHLIAICADLGFTRIKTHIASSNRVAFGANRTPTSMRHATRFMTTRPRVAIPKFAGTCHMPGRSRKRLPLVSAGKFLFVS